MNGLEAFVYSVLLVTSAVMVVIALGLMIWLLICIVREERGTS